MRSLGEWLFHMTTVLNPEVSDQVIWGVVAGVVCMSLVLTAVLWKQSEDDKTSS